LDETGFLKKGRKSAGVQRQYSGTAGRIENCQIGVFLGYASVDGRALIDRALHLPESWAGAAGGGGRADRGGVRDQAQARAGDAGAGVRGGRALRPSAAAGSRFCEDGSAEGRWVTGDSVHGGDHSLRRAVEKHGRGYVLAVTSGQHLGLKPVADRLEDVPARAWKRLSAGEGAKGPRLHDWAWLPYRSDTAQGWKKGLLIRRQIARPGEFTFYLTLSPEKAALADLVRVAGTRWTIEACFGTAKGETGLDPYEVRSWTGWHRHGTLALLAHAYLAVLRRAAVGGRGDGRPRGRVAPAHRAGGAPAAVAADLGARPGSTAGPGLVNLAPPPPAASPTLPPATADRSW
jgi:SRSO17 transposase